MPETNIVKNISLLHNFPHYLASLGTGEVAGTLTWPEQGSTAKRLSEGNGNQTPSLVFADD